MIRKDLYMLNKKNKYIKKMYFIYINDSFMLHFVLNILQEKNFKRHSCFLM